MSEKLDFLLQQAMEPKKIQKQFNISEDVAAALEQLRVGIRSKFVDTLIREELERRGLLAPIEVKKKTTTTVK